LCREKYNRSCSQLYESNQEGSAVALFPEAISFSGDDNRETVKFLKTATNTALHLDTKVWTVVAPELYIDYVHGGASMNLEGRIAYAPLVKGVSMCGTGRSRDCLVIS